VDEDETEEVLPWTGEEILTVLWRWGIDWARWARFFGASVPWLHFVYENSPKFQCAFDRYLGERDFPWVTLEELKAIFEEEIRRSDPFYVSADHETSDGG
jgi:hypothetical protein